jgi:multidrug efflux pump subunit AcrA (membrane-fusion protein)
VINKNSKQYVRVIDDSKKKTYHEVQVQTDLQADGGLVEIISGISEGQEIVTYIKS